MLGSHLCFQVEGHALDLQLRLLPLRAKKITEHVFSSPKSAGNSYCPMARLGVRGLSEMELCYGTSVVQD